MAVNALCLMDLGASAYTGGALALLPPGGCQDAVEEDGELSAMLVEALHEVVNVLSALFNTPGAPHSKLHKLYAPGEELPGDIAGMLAGFNRIDLVVDVPGLRQGRPLARPAITLSSSGRHRGQEPFPYWVEPLRRGLRRTPSGVATRR